MVLPEGEFLDNSHIRGICTRVQFAAGACPPISLIGTAEATTPLLDQPLKGSVYLRSSNHKLPDIVMDLRGQINIELVGRIDSLPGRLRASFETVPDAPVSSFKLNLQGGSTGLVINSKGLCGKPKFAMTRMVGQNGMALYTKTKLKAACGSTARTKRHQKQLADRKRVG